MTPPIRLRQLRSYRALMATGSMSSAAKRLNVTQSALSKHLAALEAAIGFRLFERRSGGPMLPTAFGREFYKSIEATLVGLDEIPEIAREITNYTKSRFRITATPPLINSRFLVLALRIFKRKHPKVRIALEPRHRLDIEEWLVSRQADVALALLPVNNPALTAIPILQVEAVAVMAPTHPLAKLRHLSPGDLAGRPVILPSRQPLREKIDEVLVGCGSRLDVDTEASSAITCCKYAAAGFGVAICDPFSPTAFSESEVVVRPWRPRIELTYGALVSDQTADNSLVEAMFQALDEAADREIELMRRASKRLRFGSSGAQKKMSWSRPITRFEDAMRRDALMPADAAKSNARTKPRRGG